MQLLSLTLENFRSYERKTFRFGTNTTLLVGNNAMGKTNVLEAISLLATGRSFRAQKTEEMILFTKELARVTGKVEQLLPATDGDTGPSVELEVLLTRGELQGKRVAKRRYRIDEVPKRYSDYVGRLVVVVFRPEDLELILGSPSVRRAFLDVVLSQIDREYRRSLVSYEKALVRRNRLLDAIREEGTARTHLAFWDQLIIKHGQVLTQKRMAFVEAINRFDAEIDSFRVTYDSSVVSASRLLQYAEQEVAVGYTLVGPHKDDFQIVTSDKRQVTSRGRDLALYGSRGEQRLAVLWLKLAELSYVSQTIGERPVLLLDDILSELDHDHRALVLRILPHQQTIMTTTDLHLVGQTKGIEVVELHQSQKD
ncbi:MAG: hypothetical protein A2900_00165 [Candidatus Chisholmbacteria bacterium RIFCSPLOWO2_01_FULL_50_28]|uniref:DNA replication and repair protein RecF n=1 Tax=Candidatus Chisholmbacteria bacterium RIFCSPHIGHO2_01_FULL_52_32 TaxID=1797591 RepID=A0A1G1VR28_9BACT|nr:MAG: hypothetical protein A2786_00400 [Candidatus Chisholmbacteria bacterium RIFCSPHIGHO2_01_FULL_52_32]OGY20742.1 MAG: hypothetical protein A2900_00165 [Candidatus Chisholmbacteria bacterium RIFCSPLOWO2_01_FULL_50_28]